MWRVKPLDQILATAEKKSLKRSLGPIQLTMLGIGAVIGTGIFVLTATAAQKAGPGMMISFIIAGAVILILLIVIAWLVMRPSTPSVATAPLTISTNNPTASISQPSICGSVSAW